MSNQGDDCYFYFYSTCTKGDSCPFRHCKDALGNETVCTLWQEGRCFRKICKFRHMEIDKKRSAIPCFWENQLSGCQKGNCAFHHTKGRSVDGVYIPPSKTHIAKPEPSETDLQISQTPSKLTTASTTHLHGVNKIEAAENVPSPTHPPVVINAADDDEDDDDQISEEGDELKPSGQQGGQGGRRAATQKTDALCKGPNFGIKTLEEIKSNRRKVQEQTKDGAISTLNVLESSKKTAITEKNVMVIRTVMFSKNDPQSSHRSLAQRLGKRKESPLAVSGGENFPAVKKTLSERLGKKMVPSIVGLEAHPKRMQAPRHLKDRLGLPPEQNSTETERAANPTTDFHIKTLQEIRQEKASQRPEQEPKCLPIKNEDHFCLKSHILIKPQPDIHVKSLHEIQAEKKLRQLKVGAKKHESKVDNTDCRVSRDLQTSQCFENKDLMESGNLQEGQAGIIFSRLYERGINSLHLTCAVPSGVRTKKPLSVSLKETKKISQSVKQVQIKTLEEIRKEKAFRLKLNCQATNAEDLESVSQQQVNSRHKRILRLSKPQASKETDKGTSDTNSQTNNDATAADTKTTVDLGPPVLVPVKISDKVGSATLQAQLSLNSANITDTQKITKPEIGCSVEPSKIKKSKDKPKVNVEPNVMTKPTSAKAVLKRKAQQSSPVAEVKPLNTTITSTVKERTTVLLPGAESSVSKNVILKSTSPKRLKESFQVPTSDPGYSGATQTVVKSRRTSMSSLGKPSVLTEDDFDELIWNISDGKLEDEIDLDPSKDEDDLLMELSEMIDS